MNFYLNGETPYGAFCTFVILITKGQYRAKC